MTTRVRGIERLDYPYAEIRMMCTSAVERRFRLHSCAKEPETIQWLWAYVKPGDVFYDVGANVGAYSLVAAALGAQVHAFEPLQVNYERLVENIALNPFLAGTVTPHRAALGESAGVVRLHALTDEPGGTTTLEPEASARTEEVCQFSLDSFVRWQEQGPDHVKIDVDGNEDGVLLGMRELLSTRPPRSVMIETAHRLIPAVASFLGKRGYSQWAVNHRSAQTYNLLFARKAA